MRRSLGGSTVERSLALAGYDPSSVDGALVETSMPTRRGHSVLLTQNLWNFLPLPQFRSLAAAYPVSMRGRMYARRALAQRNVSNAERVVVLTGTMARHVAPLVRSELVVSPVSVPCDVLEARQRSGAGAREATAVVPGTVTWFKEPEQALRVVRSIRLTGQRIDSVLFAGADDGSGAWQAVQKQAGAWGISVRRSILQRRELIATLNAARAVVMPSRLESLGLSVGESLWVRANLTASPIDAHVESAGRVGGHLTWLGAARPVTCGPRRTARELWSQWEDLGQVLGLRRPTSKETGAWRRDDDL